ncbi:MAG: TIGR04290 family methyltransferase [Alphaproteobacteria bacterium]|nr:TIGR04290 family methyltransferase [Alphaproteobacteria bacterium]
MTGSRAVRHSDPIADLGPWFHNLHLPDGRKTAPDHRFGDFPACKWAELAPHLPASLTGLRALDIGCNAGFYSFELARAGAEVVGIDHDPHYLAQARWAGTQFGLPGVSFRQQQVYDLARTTERFHLVLFMGVFYHLRYPLLALDILARLEPEWLVFQTLTADVGEGGGEPRPPFDFEERERLTERDWPFMAFIEGTFAGDPTNWWAPNHAAVCAMLRSSGFEIVARPGHEIYVCRRNRQVTVVPADEESYAAATGLPITG